jgi:hypothetical protein
MIVTRRTMIAGSGVVFGAATIMPPGVNARAATLHVHDSRLPNIQPSRRAQATHDIANEEALLWRASRSLNIVRGNIVTGETRWSDWVALRGLLAERGLRERATEMHKTSMGTIVVWEMG